MKGSINMGVLWTGSSFRATSVGLSLAANYNKTYTSRRGLILSWKLGREGIVLWCWTWRFEGFFPEFLTVFGLYRAHFWRCRAQNRVRDLKIHPFFSGWNFSSKNRREGVKPVARVSKNQDFALFWNEKHVVDRIQKRGLEQFWSHLDAT